MLNDSVRHIQCLHPGQTSPKPKIDIFDVTEKVFVKTPGDFKYFLAIQSGRRTRRKDLVVFKVSPMRVLTMADPPGQTTDVIGIAHAVQDRVLSVGIHAAAKQCELRVLLCRFHKAMQPVLLSDGVWVQQCDEGRVACFPNGQIVAGRKPQILLTSND